MSKRLKNYPDPLFIVHEYGADALRYVLSLSLSLSLSFSFARSVSLTPLLASSMYLLNSPAVHGQEMRFQQQGVRDVIRDVLLPWFNAYRFLVQSALQYQAVRLSLSLSLSRVTARTGNQYLLICLSRTRRTEIGPHLPIRSQRCVRVTEHHGQVGSQCEPVVDRVCA